LAEVIDALVDQGADVVVLSQRSFADVRFDLSIDQWGVVDGVLMIDRRSWALHEITGCYARLMDDGRLPEVRDLAPDSPTRVARTQRLSTLTTWMDVAPGTVVNRPGAMASNASKPYQAQVIARHRFSVPETLVTNDPGEALAFYRSRDRVVYKSASGVRSIVQLMTEDDLSRLERLRTCPVQFQAYVPGVDVRVHTVGGEVFASAVTSAATDYRYAVQQVEVPAVLHETELDPQVATRCLELADGLGLDFAGIDLKITPDGEVYCFEVNPSPAYSYFEAHTGQPIAAAVARHLARAG
jgi:glutathione synthase/RimK-type ligase-like ATP-grasp enzyme